ncbi:anti-sigma factor family protein [Streptomyces uncialis]|uniref:anti-sigma factor family protein n=1 Tax=Streptomyces uncialis TaxID=1048205 RepID=UPI0038172D4D
MTSSTDTTGHPGVEELSDLTEGLLPLGRATDLRLHLTGCSDCADLYASLEEIRDLLGDLPDAGPMPDEVITRIDLALAAETVHGAESSTIGPAKASRPHTTATGSATAPTAPRSAPDAASATMDQDAVENQNAVETRDAIGSGRKRTGTENVSRGTEHVSRGTSPLVSTTDRPAGHARASTGPGRGGRQRAGRRRTVTIGAVFTVAAIGLGTFLVQSLDSDSSSRDTATHRPIRGTSDTGGFSADEMEKRVSKLLAENQPATESTGSSYLGPHSSSDPSRPNTPLRGEDTTTAAAVQVPACVQQGIGRSDAPLAAEQGTFKGRNALLVVLPHPSDSGQVSAYLVDTACVTQRSANSSGKVLFSHSYARD